MKRELEEELPLERASLPEGCSDILEAYQLRAASQAEREALLLRLSALMHDQFVDQLDREVLSCGDRPLLSKKAPDFLHPLLLAHLTLEEQVRPSADLVNTLVHVVLANYEDDDA